MAKQLQYVVVIPAGGGKTTLSQKHEHVFLDVDALYNLRETESTYDRMNAELRRRASIKQPVPVTAAAELRARIQKYAGQACCLLVHSVSVAEASGLKVLSILVPSAELHQSSILDRDNTGRWFARENATCLIEDCQQKSLQLTRYSNWKELADIVAALLRSLPKKKVTEPIVSAVVIETPSSSVQEQERDEALLLSLCSIAVGCKFKD